MALLIDGYNLLHATDIFGEGDGPGGFQRSREALLAFLAASLKDSERSQTTIVFDAADAPPGLPSTIMLEGMTILYARNYPDADSLIEELIENHIAPRGLLVVSSDHRVQRAARSRGSERIDSDRWYADLWQRRIEQRRQHQQTTPEKPITQLSAAEIAYWVEKFDTDDLPDLHVSSPEQRNSPTDETSKQHENPFPPGYADDLLEGEGI